MPGTSTAVAWGCGPSQVPPGPAPQPTVMPPLVSRNAPSGSAGASPHGANVDDPITTGPFTGCRAPTGGTPGAVNPETWGRAKLHAASAPTSVGPAPRLHG